MCFWKTSFWLLQLISMQKGRGIASSQLHSWNGACSYAAYCHQEALGISHMNCTPCSQVCCELCRPGRSDRMSSVLLTFLSSLGTGQIVWILWEMTKALKNSGLSCVLFVCLLYICYSKKIIYVWTSIFIRKLLKKRIWSLWRVRNVTYCGKFWDPWEWGFWFT